MKGFAASLAAEAEKCQTLADLHNIPAHERPQILVCDPSFSCDQADLLALAGGKGLVYFEEWLPGTALSQATQSLCQQPRVCLWLANSAKLEEPLLRFILLGLLQHKTQPLAKLLPWGHLKKSWPCSHSGRKAELSYASRLGLPAALLEQVATFKQAVKTSLKDGLSLCARTTLSDCQIASDGILFLYVLRIHAERHCRELAANLFGALIAKGQRSVIVNVRGSHCLEIAQLVPLTPLAAHSEAHPCEDSLTVQDGAFFISTSS